jgi:hypothetical protein
VCADPSRCDFALDFLTQWAADESFSRKLISNERFRLRMIASTPGSLSAVSEARVGTGSKP